MTSDNFSRIYVDVVFNHMTENFPNATGVGGTTANTYNKQYPGVPYGPEHLNPTCAITNYQDPSNVSDTEIKCFIFPRMR
jgi:alpha-amylase